MPTSPAVATPNCSISGSTLLAGSTITIQFENGGKVGGQACNSFGGTYAVDGEKLTGTISGMPGGDAIEIKDGTAKADDITFNVVRSFQGQEVKIMYKGKAADGEIKFSSWRDGNEGQTREFTAKRVTS